MNHSRKIKRKRQRKRKKYYKENETIKEKYDFINKALLESVAQITEMTKSDNPTAAARVKISRQGGHVVALRYIK